MIRSIGTLSLALSAAPALAAQPTPELAVRAILYPYANSAREPATSWERPVFTRSVAELIARWKQVMPEDEPDDLSDGDWFCQCQDWDAKTFRITAIATSNRTANSAEVRTTYRIGWGEMRSARFVMRLEGGRWLLDDMFNEFNQRGLQYSLRQTIAADLTLRKKAQAR